MAKRRPRNWTATFDIFYASACQPGVSYTPGCNRIFHGYTAGMGFTGVYKMCAFQEYHHTVSHVMFFALFQCVNFSQILKPYLSENVKFLYFLACLFVILVRWPSLDHESFFVSSVQPPFIGHLRIALSTSGINCWNAAYFTVSSLPRCAVAPFGTALQFTTRSCSGPQAPWNFQSRILVTWWNNQLLSFWPPNISASGGPVAVVSGMSSLK